MKEVNGDAIRRISLPDFEDLDVVASSVKNLDISSISSSQRKKNIEHEIYKSHRKENVQKALTLMRKVEIPPIRTEHNYSPKKIFGAVSKIPLEKISQLKKSAQISLHERRIREHKMTPYQTELLSAFQSGPRRIEEALVAEIVAEEEEAIRKKNKIRALKKQAWAAKEQQPETGSNSNWDGTDQKRRYEDDLESMCTSMSFSTANISNLQDDLFDVEVEETSVGKAAKQAPRKESTRRKLSRTKSHVERNREKIMKEEEERKRARIMSKKANVVVKKEKNEVAIKQQMWLHFVVHFARASRIEQVLTHYRSQALQIKQSRLRRQAVIKIILWYRHYVLRKKMREHGVFLAKIRIRVAVYVRIRRVIRRRNAAGILIHFINCVNGSSSRTQKLYRFRARVIKIQTVFGQFYKCQRCRLTLLYMAFMRELHQARLDRNQVQNIRERISVRTMRKTPFFGEAVQKLDDICTNLTTMIARRNVINNLKMKQFLQLQNETEKKVKRSNSQHHILGKNTTHSSTRRQYEPILKRVLSNQRKRHILSQKGKDLSRQINITEHQAVDPMDVRDFLKTPGHAGPKYVVLDHRDLERKHHHSPLILLTGGAIRELRDIAKGIVALEDDKTMNEEIQKTLMGEHGGDYNFFDS